MGQILAGGFLCAATLASAYAAASPVYACLQVDNNSGGASLGYVLDKSYAVEARYRKSNELISHAGVTSDIHITATGLSVLALFPIRMNGGASSVVFAKAGYERQKIEEVYSFPISVTYNGSVTNIENHTVLGAGFQYEFSPNLGGRTGVELIGGKRSIYWAAIYTF